jgi:hypothetical protein
MRLYAAGVMRFLGLGLIALIYFVEGGAHSLANPPLAEGTVVISEFFEELHYVNVPAGTVADVLNSDPFDRPFGQRVEVLNPNSIALTSFNELHHYDVATHATSLVKQLSFNPREITRDGTGNLVAVGLPGVVHVDSATGAENLIFHDSLFRPGDVVVDASGLIYLTEFFAGLGVVDPAAGTFRPIGQFAANQFAHLDIGPDGWLYASTTFGGEFHRVHPGSGAATLLAADSTIRVEDLKVADDGTLVFGGTRDAINGVHTFDPATGIIDTAVNGTTVNDGFFSVLDLDIYDSTLRRAVPEPAAGTLLLCGCGAASAALRLGRRSGR